MAQKFYNTEKAAEVLGLTPAEVLHLREQNRLHGYRDGADWKFKTEEIEQLLQERKSGKSPDQREEKDVLLSELELGESDPSASGTVIGHGPEAAGGADSDIKLGGSDIDLGGSDLKLAGSDMAKVEMDAKVAGFDEAKGAGAAEENGTLDVDDSQINLGDDKAAKGDSAVDLAGEGLDDDDLVLGGSGSGSDITLGGDSGISLVDPADSGLSLEEPVELAGDQESLELGEDDMITLDETADTESPTQLKTDDEFLLQPLEEAGDEEDSESGSQVIALDTETPGAEAPTMAAAGAGPSMAAMLEEDLGAAGLGAAPMGGAPGSTLGMGPQPGLAPAGQMAPAVALPEAPWGALWVTLLVVCAVCLLLGGMMCYDLVRNMWSWGGPTDINSSIMDTLLGK